MARLLVVDDERDIRDLVVKRLVREGHEVLAAGDSTAALLLVQQHGGADAAVLDVDLPGMDGFELLVRLRERRPGLPALFLTALWSADVHAGIAAACAVHVAKPFTGAALAAGMRQLLCSGDCVGAAVGGTL